MILALRAAVWAVRREKEGVENEAVYCDPAF